MLSRFRGLTASCHTATSGDHLPRQGMNIYNIRHLHPTGAFDEFAHFDPCGTPQGSDPGFIERFHVSDNGSRCTAQAK